MAASETGRGGFDITFDANHLAGEEKIVASLELQSATQQAGRIDKGVAMERAEADEFGVFEAGNHAQDAALLRIGHLGLEADHVEQPRFAIILAKLDDGVELLAGARIEQADRAHRAEGEGLTATARHFLDRHAAFEINRLFKRMSGDFIGGENGVDEGVVLGLRSADS